MTTKIDAFAPRNLTPLRVELEAALKAVADAHGITISLGKMTYEQGGASFRCPLEAKVPELAEAAGRKELLDWCGIFNLDADREVTTPKGEKVKLTGYNTRARSKPWIVSVNGQDGFKAGDDWVKRAWASETPRAPLVMDEAPPARSGV